MNLLISICLLVATSTGGSGEIVKNNTLTAYDVVARIKGEVTCDWSEETVDTFKSGNPSDQVTGMAYCAQWLQSFISEVPVEFIEAGDPFH